MTHDAPPTTPAPPATTMSIERMIREGFEEYRNFVNPLVTLRANLLGEPVEAIHAEQGLLAHRDRAGTRLVEDFHGTQSFGHRNPTITAAVKEFLDSDAVNWFPSRVNPFAGSLARRLCQRASRTREGDRPAYDNVFFANSGAGAVEAALKLSRAATGKPRILSLEGAYHGCTMGACALMQKGMFRDLFAPHLPAVDALPFGDLDALAAAMSAGDVAGVIVEPIQLEGGVHPLSEAYIAALCDLTEKHGALLVADEIQTGLGRTGRFLASECWPRRPDAVVLGKHLGGGLVPISGMLTRRELFERAYGRDYASGEAHNTTFGGNALVCVAAHAALDLITDEVIERNGALGARVRGKLHDALGPHELYDEMRGAGMLIGVALKPTDHPWLSFDHFGVEALGDKPTVGVLLCYRLYKRGFYCFVCGHQWGVLRLLPRFNIDEATLDRFVSAASEELEHLCSLT